jgi:hypothetical protein
MMCAENVGWWLCIYEIRCCLPEKSLKSVGLRFTFGCIWGAEESILAIQAKLPHVSYRVCRAKTIAEITTHTYTPDALILSPSLRNGTANLLLYLMRLGCWYLGKMSQLCFEIYFP